MSERKFDVTALGELLIDFTQNGLSTQGNFMFEANPGGAPCNVLAMLARFGKRTAFIGKVGDDFLGRHLKEVVAGTGINTDNLLLDKEVHTTLAFVHTSEDGDRDFSFYRNPGADICLSEADVRTDIIENSTIFHFGSLSLTHDGVRAATHKAVAAAQKAGCIISFDPNLREPLWTSLEEAHEQIEYGMSVCDILKISDNELVWFTGREDYDKGIKQLQNRYNIPLILLSMGKEGSRAYYAEQCVEEQPLLQDATIETTGAGDTFCACVLNYVLERGLDKLDAADLHKMLVIANAAASIITTRKGALRVMPKEQEIYELIEKRGIKL